MNFAARPAKGARAAVCFLMSAHYEAAQLASLGLKLGANTIPFSVHSALQGTQAVLPGSDAKLPAGHSLQDAWLTFDRNVPAAHGVACALPTGQKVPSRHTVQFSELAMTPTKLAGIAVPAGHGNDAAAPRAQ